MRCLACDNALTEEQARKKMPVCGEHWDLCGACLRAVRVGFGLNVEPRIPQHWSESVDPAGLWLAGKGYDRWGRRLAEEVEPADG